ncbi:hypothetical protein GCM10022407_32240 [Hymenobacter antarcticus]|uniref:Uncharacterized protein n=2 Tax=Hymenobacter antarcticus TaxID=486270 RepID=A0ABP7QMX0_9BACT
MVILPSGVTLTAGEVTATEDEVGATTIGAGATMMMFDFDSDWEQALGAKAIAMGTTALNSKSLRVIRFI